MCQCTYPSFIIRCSQRLKNNQDGLFNRLLLIVTEKITKPIGCVKLELLKHGIEGFRLFLYHPLSYPTQLLSLNQLQPLQHQPQRMCQLQPQPTSSTSTDRAYFACITSLRDFRDQSCWQG